MDLKVLIQICPLCPAEGVCLLHTGWKNKMNIVFMEVAFQCINIKLI